MKLQSLVLITIAAALILSGCSGSSQGRTCDDLRENTQIFNAGRFLALKDALAGNESMDQARLKAIPVYENFSRKLGEAVPSDFDPFDSDAPQIDRIIARLYLHTLALSDPKTYDNAAQVEEWESKFQQTYEELGQTCGYGN